MSEGLDPKSFAQAKLSARRRRVAVLRRRVIGTAAASFALLAAGLGFQELTAGSPPVSPASAAPTREQGALYAASRPLVVGGDDDEYEEGSVVPLAVAPQPAPAPAPVAQAPLVTSQS